MWRLHETNGTYSLAKVSSPRRVKEALLESSSSRPHCLACSFPLRRTGCLLERGAPQLAHHSSLSESFRRLPRTWAQAWVPPGHRLGQKAAATAPKAAAVTARVTAREEEGSPSSQHSMRTLPTRRRGARRRCTRPSLRSRRNARPSTRAIWQNRTRLPMRSSRLPRSDLMTSSRRSQSSKNARPKRSGATLLSRLAATASLSCSSGRA
mmetsp:Transcript_31635/g.63189  ORF Transcript_31635/g.63189 Transcript_31635/m.63189 type:complete len:209 (-) Transcript_31635:1263-1889(-)